MLFYRTEGLGEASSVPVLLSGLALNEMRAFPSNLNF